MSRISFVIAHLLAGAVLIVGLVAALGILLAVLLNMPDPWRLLLLLAGLPGWYGVAGTANLRSWLRRIPEAKLGLEAGGFLVGEYPLPFDQVAEIRCRSIITNKRQNFAKAGRDFTVMATIACQDGRHYALRAGQGPVTGFGPTFGARSCKSLMDELLIGRQRSGAKWASE